MKRFISTNKKTEKEKFLENTFFLFLPYLGEIFFKFYDLGHFSTANRMGYSKISKMISFELYLTEVFRENFVRFFLGHPLVY